MPVLKSIDKNTSLSMRFTGMKPWIAWTQGYEVKINNLVTKISKLFSFLSSFFNSMKSSSQHQRVEKSANREQTTEMRKANLPTKKKWKKSLQCQCWGCFSLELNLNESPLPCNTMWIDDEDLSTKRERKRVKDTKKKDFWGRSKARKINLFTQMSLPLSVQKGNKSTQGKLILRFSKAFNRIFKQKLDKLKRHFCLTDKLWTIKSRKL